MKKFLLLIITFFAFLTFVNAEKCFVITGTGKNIGDEVACGTEHFYIISNDGENARMLAKYNLLTGYNYEKITFTKIESTKLASIYDSPEVRNMMEKGYSLYNELYEYNKDTKIYSIYGAIMSKAVNSDGRPAIFFESPKKNTEEILNDSKTKEMLSKGYRLYNEISYTTGYIGATFYKSKAYEYKTLVFEKEKMSYKEFYNSEKVKEKLEEGYVINKEYYNYNSGTNGEEQKHEFYGITFSKNIYTDYINFILNTEFSTSEELINYLKDNTDYQEKIDEGYEIANYYYNSYYSSNSKFIGVKLYKDTNVELEYTVLQDETAIGAHGTKEGEPDPIEIGVVSFDVYALYGYEIANGKEYDYAYYNYEFGTEEYDESQNQWVYKASQLYELELYETTLKKLNYNIKEISMLTIEDINNIVKNVTSKELPLDTWAEEGWETINSNSLLINNVYKVGSIKDYLPNDYSWLWATTYWTQTMYVTNPQNYGINGYVYFIDTLGNICADYNCPLSIGAGIRPVVTISSEDLVYRIETKTDGNGSITPSATTEQGGNEITFEIIPNEGYVLDSVTVTDKNGNVITFTDNKFTMPDSDVLIEATFIKKIDNPETIAFNVMIIIGFSIVSVLFALKLKKRLTWLK